MDKKIDIKTGILLGTIFVSMAVVVSSAKKNRLDIAKYGTLRYIKGIDSDGFDKKEFSKARKLVIKYSKKAKRARNINRLNEIKQDFMAEVRNL